METTSSNPTTFSLPVLRLGQGFSVMELVVIIAMMGVLTTVVLSLVGRQPIAVHNVKLSSDVATLNQMVAVYIADNNGDLKNVTTAQAVLDKLKRSRPQAEWKRHTGPASGRLVDPRLRAVITTVPEKNGQERARWNTQKLRFEMTTGTGSAVTDFYLDESLRAVDPGTESRNVPVVRYNVGNAKNQGWVWGSSTAGQFAYDTPGSNGGSGVSSPFNPSDNAPTPPSDTGGGGGDDGSGGGGGDGGGGGGPTNPTATQLPRPTISPSGGTFAYSAFPGMVLLSPNGAPAEGSRLEYRVNEGAWTPYSSTPISVGSADTLDARNRSTDTALYKNSGIASASYYRLISGFSGNGTGTWGNVTGGTGLVSNVQNGDDKSTFKHGNTKLDLGNGQFLDAGVENVITFDPNNFDTIVPNVWFSLGDMVMLNGTTFYNSEADGVTLSINLNLTEPAKSAVVHINLGLVNTENSTDRLASADIVELRNPSTDFTVTVDGVEYRLELSWATQDPGAGVSQGNQFLVFEGASASASLRGRFVSNH